MGTVDLEALNTSFVGEIGLDLSDEGRPSIDRQTQTFTEILKALAGTPRFVTLHSRGAEAEVARLLREFAVTGVVFHWYSGESSTLDDILNAGHYVSANPAMVRSQNGQRVLRRVPPERILTETDGPHVRGRRGPAKPWDVALVEEHLTGLWGISVAEVRAQIWENFRKVISTTGAG